MKVLVAEDDASTRLWLENALKKLGHEPILARDGHEAWLRVQEEDAPKIVILDWVMPGMDGLDLCRRIRGLPSGDGFAILIVTGRDQPDDLIEVLSAGASDYLAKPINVAQLKTRLLIASRNAAEATKRMAAEEALRESEERYALAARAANDGLWDWNLKTDAIYFSPRWKAMLGHREEEIGEEPNEWLGRVHAEDIDRVWSEINAHLTGTAEHFESEHRLRHADGTYRWMLTRGVAVRDARQHPYRMAGSQTDITERKLAEERLRHNAFHDPLTGLPNRALFMDRLARLIERSKTRSGSVFAVLFLDLDRFKVINDSLGHTIGDQLLMAISRRLEACLRAGDTVARFGKQKTIARLGGDEFTILLEDLHSEEEAAQIARRIHQELAAPFKLSGREVFTNASVGIAISSGSYDRAEDLLRDADTAMYQAKALGKGRHAIFEPGMREKAVAAMQIENALRGAVEREEFRIHYQPIIDLASGRVSAVEALVRWQHPEQGLVSPAEFLSLADDTGLILPIELMVLREASTQTRAWQEKFPRVPPIAANVNFSGRQFSQPDLVERIDRVLAKSGLDPRQLVIEITESSIIQNSDSAALILAELRRRGIRCYLDDFGTGYSSLSYLHRLPLDGIKIDHSFIAQMDGDTQHAEIVETIITLAHRLNIDVTAEGIETGAQLERLRSYGCGHAQGDLICKASDAEAVERFLASDPKW